MLKLRHLFAVLAAGISFNASAGDFSSCNHFFVNGAVPKVPPTAAPARQRELCFDAFAILHSGESKTPVFVVERLNRAQLLDAKGEERTNRFYEEARLPNADRARLEDYRSRITVGGVELRFDRGHLAPAADMPTPGAMAQSFSLANAVPQAPENNRGPWAKSIEKPTRQYVMRATGDVHVYTGTVFAGPNGTRTLGPNKVWIPSHLYKLVYDATTGRAWAHWIENTNEARASRPISYSELVRRTGIEFLPGIQVRS